MARVFISSALCAHSTRARTVYSRRTVYTVHSKVYTQNRHNKDKCDLMSPDASQSADLPFCGTASTDLLFKGKCMRQAKEC
eukprot:6186846-Pleurochrysis_carterae.AAC.3